MYMSFYALCLILLFLVFFFSLPGSLVSLSGLGGLGSFFFYRFAIVVTLLSLAGIPPMSGFFLKSFFFLLTLSRGPLLALFFSLFNLVSLYFYISSTRLLILTSKRPGRDSFISQGEALQRPVRVIVLFLSLIFLGPLFFETALALSLSLLV